MKKKLASWCFNGFINITILVATILLVLVAAETYLRIFYVRNFHPAPEITRAYLADPELIYFPRPSRLEKNMWGWITNSIGLRNEEVLSKSQGSFRIIALGDSFTHGHLMEFEESYPKALEHLLKSNGKANVEVINAGVPGYGPDQEYKLFTERLVKLNPDLLLVVLGYSDITWDNIQKSLFTIKNGQLVPLDARKHWLYIQGVLFQSAPDWLKQSYLFDYMLTSLEGRDLFGLNPKLKEEGLWEWSSDKVVKEMVNLDRLGREKGFRLIVVIHPISSRLNVDERFSENYYVPVLEKVKRELTKNGIDFTDMNEVLLSLFSTYPPKPLPIDQGVLGERTLNYQELFMMNEDTGERHLSVLGNEVFAELTFQEIQKYIP